MTSPSNITFRKIRRSSSFHSLSNSSLYDTTNMSLPNTSMDESINIQNKDNYIEKLTTDLHSAYSEIDDLNVENTKLKLELEKCLKIIDIYKNDKCESTPIIKKKKSVTKKTISREPSFSPDNVCIQAECNQNLITDKGTKEQNLKDTLINTNRLDNNIEVFSNNKSTYYDNEQHIKTTKKNVVILGDQQCRGVRQILQNLLGNDYIVTAFWKSGARLSEILKFDNKYILELTKNDYVLIIGGTNEKWLIKQKIRFFLYDNITVLHQNINGLIGKSDLLSMSLNELKNEGFSIDVLCITEHNMVEGDINQLYIPNFNIAAVFSRSIRKGGSCIMVKNIHKFKTLYKLQKYSVQNIIECCGIELVSHDITLLCIYRPPRQDSTSMQTFFDVFDKVLSEITKNQRNKKIIIGGDFNIDTLIKTKNSLQFQGTLHSFGLKFAIKEPTRLVSSTCIDNIIHNVRGSKSNVIELALSDHTAQVLKCPVKKTCIISHWFTKKRDIHIDNLIKFKKTLKALSFVDVYTNNDPNEAFDVFYDTFKLFYDLCFPILKIKVPTEKKINWISKGLKICSKRKRKCLWEYRRNKTIENKNKFKTYSRRLKNIIKFTKKLKNDNYIQTSKNKCKATWNVINSNKSNVVKEPIEKNGIFPNKLKLSVIKPLFKKGDRENLDCYRPIALITIFAKIFEKFFVSQVGIEFRLENTRDVFDFQDNIFSKTC
ncbi:uncharacterized protein LOC131842626 [Achroia grisella]|uniref:uncharacterized protein LOC131842626 n=1 Tax=Achroia grisella TaxID=688607 RepID=UPI0027D21FD9|nr:uncharacterized protein LOC131842626 [Achroia grisella]